MKDFWGADKLDYQPKKSTVWASDGVNGSVEDIAISIDEHKYFGVCLAKDGPWEKQIEEESKKATELTEWLAPRRCSLVQKVFFANAVIILTLSY